MNKHIDILFVVPSFRPLMQEESIGTLILSKIVKNSGYSSEIIRYWQADETMADYSIFKNRIIASIEAYNPKIVSFYCRSTEYHVCIDLAQKVKQTLPKSIVLFGGPQAELSAEETLSTFPFVDYISGGEGENVIVPILEFILNQDNAKKTNPTIPGFVYRNENNIVIKNKKQEKLPNNFKRGFNYYDIIPKEIMQNSTSVCIDVGRGCPFSCSFCSTKTFWGQKFRLRDIDETLDEIEYVIKHHRIKCFSFEHDLFTFRKDKVIEFCKKLKDRKLDIKWDCSSRIDTIDKETIDIMVDSGLYGIYIGIETGSNNLQKIIKKNILIEDTVDKVNHLFSKGLNITISFIYGFPQENYCDLEHTLQLIYKYIKIGIRNIQLHRLSFEIGTELYVQYKNSLIPPLDFPSVIGFPQLKQLVLSHSNVFPNYLDYPSDLRKEFVLLPFFIKMAIVSPKTFDVLLSILLNYGLQIVDVYRLFSEVCSDVINRLMPTITHKRQEKCPSIYLFFFEIFINHIIENHSNNFILTTKEKSKLLQTLRDEH